jgi:hypothetical protein
MEQNPGQKRVTVSQLTKNQTRIVYDQGGREIEGGK